MVIRETNIDKVPEKEQHLLWGILVYDLKDLNKLSSSEMEIHWQDWHNECSPERTEPCPDFYGYYTLRFKNSDKVIGVEMTLDELNISICLLIEYLQHVRTR